MITNLKSGIRKDSAFLYFTPPLIANDRKLYLEECTMMKAKTAYKIAEFGPYGLAALSAAAVFAVTRLYGRFCNQLGMDDGVGATVVALKNVDPKAYSNFIECAQYKWFYDHESKKPSN